jgi:hypothetical protein
MHAARSIGFLAVAGATLIWVGACSRETPHEPAAGPVAATAASPASAPADRAPAAQPAVTPVQGSLPPAALVVAKDLPLLPAPGLARAVRPPETVRMVYEFAARHPEVLKYVPCFCGCEQSGHVGNDDCFVSARDAAGKVREWEPHGLVCEVCIDVGQQAMQMHNAGASLTAIRAAVEKKFSASHSFHTPTPQPPRKTGTHD